jgi:hypothetical protein
MTKRSILEIDVTGLKASSLMPPTESKKLTESALALYAGTPGAALEASRPVPLRSMPMTIRPGEVAPIGVAKFTSPPNIQFPSPETILFKH